ncbi:MAG: leucine-rich repeat protein, partial [Clostridia bacterium]|nr:leucine-rich repeat protein [Clostridia bacterium]
ITVGENVKYIGSGAFMKCINIESVTMEDDVVSIGGEAFADCAKLAEVDMSSNIVSVGYQAFVNTKIWTDASNIVYVGDWLVDTKVKDAAVYEIEEGTFGIAIGAFAFLTTVNSITLPNSVKIIDSQAFVNCNELTTVIIGSGVEVIRTRAFGSCVKLSNVVLGEYDWNTSKIKESSLQRIEQYAFMNCKLLSYIDIPDTVEFIGGYAFRKTALISVNGVMYADDWIVDYDDMGMLMAMMMGWNGELKEGTRGVGEYAFYKAQLLSNVVLPESVEIINRCAFMEASALNSVVLPSTLTSIEEYTFYSCYNILQIELPETLEYIGTGAFRNCLGLGLKIENNAIVNTDEDTFVIPDSVKEIGDYAFYGCGVNQPIDADGNTELWGTDILVIGDGVTKIGKNAFANFISLTDVQIGANVETIGEKAFYKATALKNVTFGEKVTSIGKRAFYGCTALESIVLPESVTVIDDYTFYKCEKVKSISLGSGVTTIGKYAFYGCKELKSLSIPESVVSIGKLAFRNASEVKSLVIYDTLATIENYAFYNWKNVTFYVVSSTAGENWGERWNSSHRPVVWGVTLSDEGYVVSFTKTATSFDNFNDKTVVNGPERAGYTFAGWTSVQGGAVEYTASNVVNAPDGTVLYAVWKVAITE